MNCSEARSGDPSEGASSQEASSLDPIDEAELARLRALPWITLLDAGDLAQLIAEYEGALREAYRSGDRAGCERVLADWERKARQRNR